MRFPSFPEREQIRAAKKNAATFENAHERFLTHFHARAKARSAIRREAVSPAS
jgi:hypothetical protein